MDNFQDVFNLLPNLKLPEMVKNFSIKSNDYMYVLYISSLVRSILSLHSLINNKINAKDIEIEKAKMLKDEEEEKLKKKKEEEEKKAAEKAEWMYINHLSNYLNSFSLYKAVTSFGLDAEGSSGGVIR